MAQFLEGGITKTYVEDLLGTRCRLQRLRDLKFLSGWVRNASGQHITVELKEPLQATDGEAFNLEAATGEFNVAYPCMLVKAEGDLYRLNITGEALVTTPGQEPRYRAHQLIVALQGPNGPVQVEAIDISASGMGLLSYEPLARFAKVKIAARNHSNAVECNGIVRYCRQDPHHKGCHRIGIQLEFEDRLSRAMWMRMVQTAAQTVDKVA